MIKIYRLYFLLNRIKIRFLLGIYLKPLKSIFKEYRNTNGYTDKPQQTLSSIFLESIDAFFFDEDWSYEKAPDFPYIKEDHSETKRLAEKIMLLSNELEWKR